MRYVPKFKETITDMNNEYRNLLRAFKVKDTRVEYLNIDMLLPRDQELQDEQGGEYESFLFADIQEMEDPDAVKEMVISTEI